MRVSSNLSKKEREIINAMSPALKHRFDSKRKREKIKETANKINARDIKKQKLKDEVDSAILFTQLEKKLKKESKKKSKHLRNMMLKPFKAKVEEIANTIESRREAMMYIIKGATNQGKTYTSAKFAVPHLMKKYSVDVVFYTYPQNEIFNKNEWRTKGYEIIAIGENDQKISSQIESVIDDIKYGNSDTKYVIAMTNKTLACSISSTNSDSYGRVLTRKLDALGKKMAFFLDECHTWTISHIDSYKETTGNPGPPQYDASLFKFVAWLSNYTNFLFGLTATPNFEQTGLRSTIKKEANLEYEVINEFPDLEDLIHGQAWANEIDFMDMKDETDIRTKVRNLTKKHLSENMTLSGVGLKGTMFIQCNTKSANDFRAYETLATMQNIIKDVIITEDIDDIYRYMSDDTASFAIVSSERKWQGVYSLFSEPCEGGRIGKENGYLTETEIYKRLGDPNDPLTFLIAIQKGKMGLSVHSFRSLISFKKTEKYGKDDDNNKLIVTTMHIQTLGRLPRLYVGPDNKAYVDTFGYSTFEYIARASEAEIDIMKLSNSYNVLVADTKTWRESVEVFKEKYGTTLEMAEKEIARIRAEFPLSKNINNVLNGGIVSNKNGFLLEAKVCLALIIQVDELNKRLGLVGDDQYRVHYLKYKELLPLLILDHPEYKHLLAPYPTEKTVGGRRRILSNKNEGGEYEIDLDAYIAKRSDAFNVAVGFTIKNATKDQNGDGLLNGLLAMEVDLGFPAMAIVNLYSVDESVTQKKSNTFANKKSSNTYDKLKFMQHKNKESLENGKIKIYGLNDITNFEKINPDFTDLIKLFYDDGCRELERILIDFHEQGYSHVDKEGEILLKSFSETMKQLVTN